VKLSIFVHGRRRREAGARKMFRDHAKKSREGE
jgi:hypothetical protein